MIHCQCRRTEFCRRHHCGVARILFSSVLSVNQPEVLGPAVSKRSRSRRLAGLGKQPLSRVVCRPRSWAGADRCGFLCDVNTSARVLAAVCPALGASLHRQPHACSGRVEDGRGSLGPLAIAPFPIPAHQTGRADFRHPAFRLASPRGTRRGSSGQALEAQNAEFSMNHIECESAIAVPLHLVPSHEEPAHAFNDVLVDATVCLAP